MDKEILLTAKESLAFDEIGLQKKVSDETLKLGLQYHSNQQEELAKREAELWETAGEKYDFDPREGYKTECSAGQVRIVPFKS